MLDAAQFPFTVVEIARGEASLMPMLPITLGYQSSVVSATGLLDTGAAVNVLPHHIGIELGAIWDPALATIKLGGNLAHFPACPLVLSATIEQFDPVRLAFAWTETDDVPLILGQVNFFMEFDTCFYRSQQIFEVRPKN